MSKNISFINESEYKALNEKHGASVTQVLKALEGKTLKDCSFIIGTCEKIVEKHFDSVPLYTTSPKEAVG